MAIIKGSVEELPEIASGLVWSSYDKKVYTIIEVIEDNVQYVVNKPGKKAKIKNKHIDKVVKLLLEAETIFSSDMEKPDKKINVKGILIDARKLTLRDLPLEKPLSNGLETIYCFSLNQTTKQFLIGDSRSDINPTWVKIEDLFAIVDDNFLMSLSEGEINFNSEEDPKIIQAKALEAIKNLKNK